MFGRLRTRATATLGVIWAGVFGAVGFSVASWAVLHDQPQFRLAELVGVLRYAAAWSVAGGVCGITFAIAVMALARRRPLERLPSVQICSLAALAGFGFGAVSNGGAFLLGIVAAGLAFGSLQLAKYSNAGAPAAT